ncbi:MAG: 2-aminoadipate aminotransferase [Betaproteobacteria bacterium HGW-Betaproteobacteria-13]|uniref:2-aminoadipate aminotransferase n=1 Tax=Parazoarcus communis TaxID=41977 RepID=A0A2U8H5D1_9RHOO|nr:PLP-dependent aminotransferase family protein [Parazoarcus communis]AWI80720.1 2-aminoadipate aminotransferase [Parazoarcus communis]PKO82264.1 MAG: 2-aminoadipate aminotransferase [Betaproteobacteria bacterium HGW-Betaproteobacteria-13]
MSFRPTSAMWKQFMQREATSAMSLQGQIRQMLVAAILDQQIPLDEPIPSSRELSSHIGVARNTVVIAYQQLVDEGYLLSRERKGHFVNPAILEGRAGKTESPLAETPAAAPDWSRRFRFRPSAQRNISKRADWQTFPYPFVYGQFDPTLFPTADWRECCMKTLSVLEISEWAQDMILRDDESLVRQIRTRVLPRRGVRASDDEIVITVGTQQALYLLADLLMSSDTPVGIENPGYPDARNIFSSRSKRMENLDIDEHGLIVSERLKRCDYVYVTPSHQCPTTVTMPLERREALLKMAEASDFIIIEDDYDSENPFEGEPLPALKSLDCNNRVIYVGSLSKSLAPGMRLGYVVGPAELIRELRGVRRLNLRHPAAYMQRAFAIFLSLGHHDSLLRRLSAAHNERACALSAALSRHLPDFRHVPISGGSSCWVAGPAWLDANELADEALKHGILIETGSVFFTSDSPPANYFRLGFSSIAAERIEAGIKSLAEVVSHLRPSE